MLDNTAENVVDGCCGLGCLIMIPFLIVILLFIYGVFVLVMRSAFGIELPNPIDWLPPDWRDFIPTSR